MGRQSKNKIQETSPLNGDSLDAVVEGIKDTIGDVGAQDPTWFLHSGNLALDYIMSMKVDGSGGYPSGQICELFGDPSTGKTLLILKAGAAVQRAGGIFALADVERRYDKTFGAIHGVDNEKLVRFYPKTIETFTVESYEMLSDYGKQAKILIAVDSLAALSTEKEVDDAEKKDLKADQGRRAQKIKQAMRVLPGLVADTQSILMLSNHIIDNTGGYGGTNTPGGRGPKFHSTVRLEMLRTTPILIEGKMRPIGVTMRVRVAKNSVAPPFGECEMELTWSRGLDRLSGLIDIAVDLDIIKKSGAWMKYGDISFYAKDFANVLADHPEILLDDRWSKNYFTHGVGI